MGKRVGIPRSLLYYIYYPGWKKFFEELGAEIVLSPPTNKKILDLGVKDSVDEVCLPVKLYFGHLEVLKDKVDYLFVPRVISISKKEWICPKFIGLPDMVKAQLKDLPPMISPDLNMRKSRKGLYNAAVEAAEPFTKSSIKVLKALYLALREQRKFKAKLKTGLTPIDILEKRENKRVNEKKTVQDSLVIALLGHPYLIYESFINMDLIRRLREMGVRLVSPEMIEDKTLNKNAALQPKSLFWTLNKKVMGAGYYFLSTQSVDGIIQMAAFGCGPDALVNELVERRVRRDGNIPLLSINIDEHSGEAGLVTRLEAFIDMIKLRRGMG
ncbi:MAG: hypothetical protein KAX49_16395 [Halanaerobiales bacterium]|nr:hypothetical protein [Halanaerobiales bacterium]